MLAHQFMRAEREYNWIQQQHCLERMMPYLIVAGLHHYARYISWHLRDMQHTQHYVKEDLLNGAHVCCHTEGAAALSGDQYGEQTIQNRENKPGTEGHIDQPWTSRRLDRVDRSLFSHYRQSTECTLLTQDLHQRQELWSKMKKAARGAKITEMIGSGFCQSCGSIHTHWHTSLTHRTTSWTDNWALTRK